MKINFVDGVKNVFNGLINRRNALEQNEITHRTLDGSQLREINKSGMGSMIVKKKAGYSLKDTITFDSKGDKEFYNERLAKQVKKATRGMIGYGRGIIVLFHKGDDISKPLNEIDENKIIAKAFTGDIVTVGEIDLDLASPRYYKPKSYNVRGYYFHHSRVIDFSYVEPPEFDAAEYLYGGISEFELIYNQLINDGIIERASASIIEKASTFVYKIKDYKQSLMAKQDEDIVRYISNSEDARTMFGALLIDSDDSVDTVEQRLNSLDTINDNSLRRIAAVTGIPLPWLIGENVKGMNAVGENERLIFQETIESLQSDYLLDPINELMAKFGRQPVKFKENQGESPTAKINYDKTAIENAGLLNGLGEDSAKYLNDKGVIERDEYDDFWTKENDGESKVDKEELQRLMGGVSNG